ncbi:MAG: Gmad2 immunoglobulin-like domain-containing protein [Candidatus Peribacteraceae bacterium]|jgi:hypothetical protein
MKTISLLLSAVSVLALASLAACNPTGNTDGFSSSSAVSSLPEVPGNAQANVIVDMPQAGDKVTSPFTVSGKARGTWFFEASFPVKLLDGNGNEIVSAPAQASGDWMTTDFVPFSVTLTFTPPSTPTGTLVLQKDNPSGLPENDASVEMPVQF